YLRRQRAEVPEVQVMKPRGETEVAPEQANQLAQAEADRLEASGLTNQVESVSGASEGTHETNISGKSAGARSAAMSEDVKNAALAYLSKLESEANPSEVDLFHRIRQRVQAEKPEPGQTSAEFDITNEWKRAVQDHL